MENKIIAKTLLAVYPGLAAYEAMLRTRMQSHALDSFNGRQPTYRLMDKIINLNIKQQTIHTLRVRLQHLISRQDPLTQKVLHSYYHDCESAPNVAVLAARLHLPERTFFRRLSSAQNYVAQHLDYLGLNFFTWQYLLQHHRWLQESYLREMQPHRRRITGLRVESD